MRLVVAALRALAPLSALAQMPSAGLVDSAPALPDIRVHGDWRVACAGAECIAEPLRQTTPLSVSIARDGDGQVLVLRAPLGLLLGEGVAVSVDGRALGRLAFLTCESDGCVAPVRLDGGLRSALRAGQDLSLTIIPRAGDPVEARYSLIGFIAATGDLDAAATDLGATTPP
jgi:invasion protein IalB